MKNDIRFCGECMNLNPTEKEQDLQKYKIQHVCMYYTKRLYHRGSHKNHHPNILRCDKCLNSDEFKIKNNVK